MHHHSAWPGSSQTELGAYGYEDGRYAGVGEHDDMVIAAWLTECAILFLEELIRQPPAEELVTMEDIGLARVRIGDDW